MIDEVRVGRAIARHVVELTVDDYAALLGAATWRPVSLDHAAPPTDQVIARGWEELIAIDRDLADRTFDSAKAEGAHPFTIIGLARRLNQENTP